MRVLGDGISVIIIVTLACFTMGLYAWLSYKSTQDPNRPPIWGLISALAGGSAYTRFNIKDANGPSCEALLLFHDFLIFLLLPILFLVLLFMLSLPFSIPTHRFLLDSQRLEFLWTLLPTALLLCLAVPSLSLLYMLDEVGFPSSTTKVHGHQ